MARGEVNTKRMIENMRAKEAVEGPAEPSPFGGANIGAKLHTFTIKEHAVYEVTAQNGEEALDIFLNAENLNEYFSFVEDREVLSEDGSPVMYGPELAAEYHSSKETDKT